MFSKTFFVVAAFVAGALATEYVLFLHHWPACWLYIRFRSGRCSTSNQFCCDSFTDSKNPQVADICHSLGVPVDADVVVGLTCTPISVIAIAGNKWLVFLNVTLVLSNILIILLCIASRSQLAATNTITRAWLVLTALPSVLSVRWDVIRGGWAELTTGSFLALDYYYELFTWIFVISSGTGSLMHWC